MEHRPNPIAQEYARLAGRYDRRWAGYIRRTVEETVRRLSVTPGERVLDVGCGTGVLLASLVRDRGARALIGLDLCHEMLRVAKRKAGSALQLVTGNVETPPFRAAAFGLVVSTSSFHYWSDPRRGLQEIRRLLAPGGRLVVTDWCNDYLTCRVCDLLLRVFDRAHRRAYGSAELSLFLERAGFRVVALDRYKINWLWGIMTVSATRAD